MAVPTQALPTLLTSRPQVSLIAKGLAAKDPAEERTEEAKPAPKLPKAYAMPIRVRNTFIDTFDTVAELSPSLEHFYREREVSTCPSAHIGRFSRLFEEEVDDASKCWSNDDMDTQLPSECQETRSASEASPSNAAAQAGPSCVLSLAKALSLPDELPATPTWEGQAVFGDGCVVGGVAAQEVPCEHVFGDWGFSLGEVVPAQYVGVDGYYVEVPCDGFGEWQFSWQEAPPQGAPVGTCFADGALAGAQCAVAPVDVVATHGTPPLPPSPPLAAADAPAPPSPPASGDAGRAPSVGSELHAVGGCKPCAFFHTVGCGNGSSCEFCHLCGPDERKRRRKAKLDSLREDRVRKAGRPGAPAESRKAKADLDVKG